MARKVYQLILTIEIMESLEGGLHLIPKTIARMLEIQFISFCACVSLEIYKRYSSAPQLNFCLC